MLIALNSIAILAACATDDCQWALKSDPAKAEGNGVGFSVPAVLYLPNQIGGESYGAPSPIDPNVEILGVFVQEVQCDWTLWQHCETEPTTLSYTLYEAEIIERDDQGQVTSIEDVFSTGQIDTGAYLKGEVSFVGKGRFYPMPADAFSPGAEKSCAESLWDSVASPQGAPTVDDWYLAPDPATGQNPVIDEQGEKVETPAGVHGTGDWAGRPTPPGEWGPGCASEACKFDRCIRYRWNTCPPDPVLPPENGENEGGEYGYGLSESECQGV